MRTVIEKSLLLVLGLFMIFPIFWMLEASVKDQSTILANPPSFVGFEPTMDNYRDVFFERAPRVRTGRRPVWSPTSRRA